MNCAEGDAWVVVPAFNEERRVGDVLMQLRRIWGLRVVVVDDGSRDGTAKVAGGYPVWVLRHAVNLGQGAALATGIRFALEKGAMSIGTFDSDGQHDARDLAKMIERVRSGAVDACLGSRFLGRATGLPLQRRVVLHGGRIFTWAFSGRWLTDTHNGLRVMNRTAAEALGLCQNGMAHASEILDDLVRSGLRIEEWPVTIRYTADTLEKGQKGLSALAIAGKVLLDRVLR